MRILFLLAAVLSISRAEECFGTPKNLFGRVEVAAVDSEGISIDDALMTLANRATGDIVSRFHGSADRVPYGEYLLRVSRIGYPISEQVIRISQPEAYLRVTLSLARSCGNSWPGVYGTLKGAQAKGSMWVKLVPARGGGSHEARVRSSRFALPDIDPGDYFLLVVEGDRILHSRAIKTTNNKDVKLQLDLSR
jgi:hypothetical protein